MVLRRRIKRDVALTAKKRGSDDAQLVLLPHNQVQDNAQLWEYTVLVTNAEYVQWSQSTGARACRCSSALHRSVSAA